MPPRLLVSLSPCLLVFCLTSAAVAQPTPSVEQRPLRLGGVFPQGVRTTTTEGWSTFIMSIDNLSTKDRVARVLTFYEGQEDVQYGRDVWVPARTSLKDIWMLVGPANPQVSATTGNPKQTTRDMQILLFDRTDGQNRQIFPVGESKINARGVTYRKREPTTTICLDALPEHDIVNGQLPVPETPAEEALHLARVFRATKEVSDSVLVLPAAPIPPTPEAFDAVDHFVLGSSRILDDPVGLRALRRWAERGGRVWVLLDMIDRDVAAPLLGEAIDFHVIDHVSLTRFKIEEPLRGARASEQEVQTHERPVAFVRVQLPAEERVTHTINGYPVWFTRPLGRGKVIFTTLGARGWYRDRLKSDTPSPFPSSFPSLPIGLDHMQTLTDELQPTLEGDGLKLDAFRPALLEEIGYSIISRQTVAVVFGTFLVAALGLALLLRRSSRPELSGWLTPLAALVATGAFVVLGYASRQQTPTVAQGQIVETVPGSPEVAVRGLFAMFRPDSGLLEGGAERGGLFELDDTGLSGQTRRRIQTDIDSWRWENLSLPAGVREATFRTSAPTNEPIVANASFTADGLVGKLQVGPFEGLEDGLLSIPGSRSLAVRFGEGGKFTGQPADVLPPDQYLLSTLMTDRQQRRQDFYKEYLKKTVNPLDFKQMGKPTLLAWAKPIETHFKLVPDARLTGSALLVIPLTLERTSPGTQVTIPAPFLPQQRLVNGVPVRPMTEGRNEVRMHVRYQLPGAVLPLEVTRARLTAKVDAALRRVTVYGREGDKPTEVYQTESPLDVVRVDITDPKYLQLDAAGGLQFNLGISDLLKAAAKPGAKDTSLGNEQWAVRYLELEVQGQTLPDAAKAGR